MTTWWVNNTKTGDQYDKMPNSQSVTMTNSSLLVTGAPASLVIGQHTQIDTGLGFNTYRIETVVPVTINQVWAFASGSYDMYYGDASTYDGQSEAFAYTGINRALRSATGNDSVNIKWSPSGYILSHGDQIKEVIDPQGSGSVLLNKQLIIEGYKDNVGDMRWGGLHYQSPMGAFINGIDATKKVAIDGDAALTNLLNLDGVDNIVLRNFRFTGSTGSIFTMTNTPVNVLFENCVFDDVSYICNVFSGRLKFHNCYATNMSLASGNIFKLRGFGFLFDGCILELPGSVVIGINIGIYGTGGSCCFGNNLIINGSQSIHSKGYVDVRNSILYNPAVAGIVLDDNVSNAAADVHNNIIMPTAHDTGVAFAAGIAPGDGGTFNNDFNCIFGVDGQQLDNVGSAATGNVIPVLGENGIEADPLFIDSPGGDFRLEDGSPCINTGSPDAFAGYSNIGPFQNLQLTRQRLNHV